MNEGKARRLSECWAQKNKSVTLSGIFHFAQPGDQEVGKNKNKQKDMTQCDAECIEQHSCPPTTWKRCSNSDDLFSFANRLRFQQLAKTLRACLPRRATATRSICANNDGRRAIKPVATRLGGC